jgi:hypothetical protein
MMGGASCIDLDAIERRTVGPTRGPFDIHRYDNDGGDIRYQLQQSDSAFPKDDDGINIVLIGFSDIDLPNAKQNAEFYAHALMDVIALCAELRRAWVTIVAQGATIAKLTSENEINAQFAQKLGVLSAMLNTLGLPDEPKALAREINNLRDDIERRAASHADLLAKYNYLKPYEAAAKSTQPTRDLAVCMEIIDVAAIRLDEAGVVASPNPSKGWGVVNRITWLADRERHASSLYDAARAKIDKDKKRMSWLINNELVPEGFGLVVGDRYDNAVLVAAENGRVEPNDDDCIEGFWRVVDAAMGADVKIETDEKR